MKRVFTVLIALFLVGTATGIGQNTSDLDHNSTTVDFSPGDEVTAIVLAPALQEVFIYKTSDGHMEVKRFKDLDGCEYLSFGDVIPTPSEDNSNLQYTDVDIGDRRIQIQMASIVDIPSNETDYRRARDGLNKS